MTERLRSPKITREEYIEKTGISGNALIEDADKAHLMALAGNERRTRAKEWKAVAGVAIDAFEDDVLVDKSAGGLLGNDEFSMVYQGQGPFDAEEVVNRAGELIDIHEEHANNEERKAADRYDRAKKMREELGIK